MPTPNPAPTPTPAGGLPAAVLQALARASLSATPGPTADEMPPAMALALQASFGSLAHWRADLARTARALGGQPGWVLLALQPETGTLTHQAAAGPGQVRQGSIVLLALALAAAPGQAPGQTATGAGAGAAVQAAAAATAGALADALDAPALHARYQQALALASAGLGITAAQADGRRRLDVRRAAAIAPDGEQLAGATWRDPAQVASWATDLPPDEPLLVYCVHGHEVSQAIALRLHAAGRDARYLIGGIEGWRAEGRPLQARARGKASGGTPPKMEPTPRPPPA